MSSELELLAEWRILLQKQIDIIEERGEGNRFGGMVGVLVAKDDLAREYQAVNCRIWDIKTKLFGMDLLFKI